MVFNTTEHQLKKLADRQEQADSFEFSSKTTALLDEMDTAAMFRQQSAFTTLAAQSKSSFFGHKPATPVVNETPVSTVTNLFKR